MADHPELVETAFSEYLRSLTDWNDDLGNGEELRIYPGESDRGLDGAAIACYIPDGQMGEEDPPCSGNRWCDIHIELTTPVTTPADESGDTTVDPEAADSPEISIVLKNHKENADALQAAILDTNLPDLLSEAIDGFCCFGVVQRTPVVERTPEYWKSGWVVKLLSCPSAIA